MTTLLLEQLDDASTLVDEISEHLSKLQASLSTAGYLNSSTGKHMNDSIKRYRRLSRVMRSDIEDTTAYVTRREAMARLGQQRRTG